MIFNGLRAFLGNVKIQNVKKNGTDLIELSGLNSPFLVDDLRKVFSTSKVASGIFTEINKYSLTFDSFFALEVRQIMSMIINSKEKLKTSRRTAAIISELLDNNSWLINTRKEVFKDKLNKANLKNFKYQPLVYQHAYLDKFNKVTQQFLLRGMILDSIMGSGKTMTSLYVSECAERDIKLIVCPNNSLDSVWAKTISNDILRPIKYWSIKSAVPYNGEEYILINFEGIRKAIDLVKEIRSKGKTFSIVIDECHNFADPKTAQSLNLIELCAVTESDIIVPQSGTTFKAIGAEIVTIMRIIDPLFSDDVAKRFSRLYGASATEALELLKNRMGFITHKVTKEDVGLGEPIINNFDVNSPNAGLYTLAVVTKEMRDFVEERIKYYASREKSDTANYFRCLKEYEKTLRGQKDIQGYQLYRKDVDIIRKMDARNCPDQMIAANAYEKRNIIPRLNGELKTTFIEARTIYKYVKLKINGECLGRILANKRKECATEIAKYIPYQTFIESTTKKTLVYTVYIDTLKAVKETLDRLNYQTLAVYGETNKNLNSIINTFEKDPAVNPLIATYKSLSTAVPMTMADVMIMVDTPFRDYIFQQTIARINRLGTTTQTYVYIAKLNTGNEPNLSTRTIDILKWSQQQIEAITGVKSPFEITDAEYTVESFNKVIVRPEDFKYDTDLEAYYTRKLI